ncbi:hypothetical protein J4227_04825 [Candidatus Woesearchaeota archaeon]|nr:hypothetical protein [Candidatus Woesearchaeota archaeon]
MAAYHPSEEDEFSPKKYALTSAVKDMFKYQGHSHGGDEEEDVLYHQEKMYGRDDGKSLGDDYLKRDEENEDFLKKDEKFSSKDEGIDDKLGEKYKKVDDDEIAKTLFRAHMPPGFGLESIEDDEDKKGHGKKHQGKKHDEDGSGGIPGSVDDIIKKMSWNRRR